MSRCICKVAIKPTLKLTDDMVAALTQALRMFPGIADAAKQFPEIADAAEQFATATRDATAAITEVERINATLRLLTDDLLREVQPDQKTRKRKHTVPKRLRDTDQPAPDDLKDMSMDDFLDDLAKPINKTFKQDPFAPLRPKKKTAPAPPEDYYAIPGNSTTYEAREALKALGGFWDPEAKCWYLPKDNRTKANAVLNEAVMAASLHKNNPDAVAELLRRNVPIKGMPQPQPVDVTCWECGQSLYEGPSNGGAARFRSVPTRTTLRAGAVIEERYCGCAGRNERPRSAGRPNFRDEP